MALNLMYITNNTEIALIAENAGVQRIFVDMEYIGKEKRQGGMNTVDVYKRQGVDIKDTYAFGDDFNDTEMLGAVGHGIAMTPHAESLDEVAEYITCGVGGDGIYMGLKHYGLAE